MKLNAYQKVALATVAATIFLNFVGVFVRVSGAGLGCPDWPKCFGLWIPPLSAAQLPAAFDPSQFNAVKMWTEYVNRLTGVMTGFLIIATCVLSFRYRKSKPSILYSSVAALVLVLVEGWLGGAVVYSGLAEYMVTIHMVLGLAIMAILLYSVFKATEKRWMQAIKLKPETRRWLFGIGIMLFVFTVIQIMLGTQTRSAIDQISGQVPAQLLMAHTGAIVKVHRSFSWTVFLSGWALVFLAYRRTESSLIRKLVVWIMATTILQIALGAGLYYLDMPPAFQVLHLVVACFMVCFEFLIILVTRPSAKPLTIEEKKQKKQVAT
jgi:cytochrome c oxidase assembly protein subunit 15